MTTLKSYPIGIQTFEEIIKRKSLYVDKTEYIYRLAHTNGKYFFLSRPRRFGKSLLISTFKRYFEGKKDLFKGLAIEKLEKDWTEYPVLRFDLSGGKHMEKEQLGEYLDYILSKQEHKWGVVTPPAGANNRLTNLISTAYKNTGKQVVVLIDEYDAPMLDVVHERESLDVLRNIMRNFYSPLKMCEPMLRFVFLTGITKFSQLSIFSELNNISNISMLPQYAGICGITKEELQTVMAPDVEALGRKIGETKENTLALLQQYYDGYHFASESPDIFNPFSLLSAMANGKIDSYCFTSEDLALVSCMMERFGVSYSSIAEDSEADASDFDLPTEVATTILPYLYHFGYITIKDYDSNYYAYLLGFPNNEVRASFAQFLA